jgi:hypothetical protein
VKRIGPAISGAMAPVARRLHGKWPFVVLGCVLAPLLWMAIVVAIRAELFNPAGSANLDVGAFLTFVGATLGTAATVFAALLTSAHNARERQRLRLDTVVRSLESLPEDAIESRTAGVVSTMVLLGQERIAMRVLLPAWDAKQVDPGTATWLIDQVLTGAPRSMADGDRVTEAARSEAADLLVLHAKELAEERTGRLQFPGSINEKWTSSKPLPAKVKLDVLEAIGVMLASREKSWWSSSGNLPRWPTLVLLDCVRTEEDAKVRGSAAVLLDAMRDCFPKFAQQIPNSDDIHTLATAFSEQKTLGPTVYARIADQIREKWQDPADTSRRRSA